MYTWAKVGIGEATSKIRRWATSFGSVEQCKRLGHTLEHLMGLPREGFRGLDTLAGALDMPRVAVVLILMFHCLFQSFGRWYLPATSVALAK
eukprot:421103-Amphidinium_carterae.3